jgi:hypothetical protein
VYYWYVWNYVTSDHLFPVGATSYLNGKTVIYIVHTLWKGQCPVLCSYLATSFPEIYFTVRVKYGKSPQTPKIGLVMPPSKTILFIFAKNRIDYADYMEFNILLFAVLGIFFTIFSK